MWGWRARRDGAVTHPGHVLTALVTPSSVASSTTWSDVTGSTVTNDPTDAAVFNRAQVGISAIAVDSDGHDGQDGICGDCRLWRQGFAPLAWPNVPVLYGSTDAGSTWQNLTNNLPNAPVNAVLVDPEDPAIVYVGTDVGVYVTTSITQCADREPELLERLRHRAAGGAGDDAERGRYEWREVAAGGHERARRVAGGAGEQALKTTTATATIGTGYADLRLAGGGHHERRGEPDDPEHWRDCADAGRCRR